jgi:UDP-N-acetylglucosamine 1-carboxyvinyltransferase
MKFRVQGGARLSGIYHPQGAKNEALQVLSAALLTSEPVIYENVPRILDVERHLELIAGVGAKVEWLGEHTVRIVAQTVEPRRLLEPEMGMLFRRIRGSVLLAGALLGRCGEAYLYRPGGDKIGRRRLDTHLLGFEALGATISYDDKHELYKIVAPRRLQGKFILLEEASVTGTANILLAAASAEGETTLYHAACEPYIQQLCHLLNRMGVSITGIGSNRLTLRGQSELKGAHHVILPDVIEIGSLIGLAAMTQSPLEIAPVPVEHMGPIIHPFERLGIPVHLEGERVRVEPTALYEPDTLWEGHILTLSDHTWPGTPPDLLSILLVVAAQAAGQVLIHQKMFESRLFFVDRLIEMGAQVVLCDPHRAMVIGLGRRHPLRGITMSSPDIRAGIALLIAALSAEGESVIENAEQIARGYEAIDIRLNALGAQIQRE